METIIPTVQETNLRENGFLLLTQSQVDAEHNGNPDIIEFPNGGRVYRDGSTALVQSEIAQDPALIIWGYHCNILDGFQEEAVYLYEVVPYRADQLFEWGELYSDSETVLKVLAWVRYASVPAGLAFHSFILLDKR